MKKPLSLLLVAISAAAALAVGVGAQTASERHGVAYAQAATR